MSLEFVRTFWAIGQLTREQKWGKGCVKGSVFDFNFGWDFTCTVLSRYVGLEPVVSLTDKNIQRIRESTAAAYF